MDERLILAIDAGTTSVRAIVFQADGAIVASAGRPLSQHFPQPGWVEQDAAEIRALAIDVAGAVVSEVGADRVAAIGIANQRETVVFWSRATGEPLAPAIVWQDRRTADVTARLRAEGHEAEVQATTGLLLDPYFSATKIGWAMANWPRVAAAAEANDLALGTVDSWLVWALSEGRTHLTDATNASRTLLMDLAGLHWRPELLRLFDVPFAALPSIAPSWGRLADVRIFGPTLPLAGIVGDQQAATIGQGCLSPGEAKCTYGTGIFLLANAGEKPPVSRNRLIATLLGTDGAARRYALEGSIFVGGDAVKWLRDGLGILDTAAESEALAARVPDSGGLSFVPAFAGLGAPHWQPEARGLIAGITGGTTRAHLVRATLEAMSQQTADLIEAFAADGVVPSVLRVDGGMTANTWLCQDIADATGLIVERPRVIETTALGAAMVAGVGAGIFPSLERAAERMVAAERRFTPRSSAREREARREAWRRAVAQTVAGL
ncbi:MAG: glycerol kinase GlpK [Thermaurantiacus sp.]